MPEYRVGCSGWNYDDWAGRFFPAEIPKKDWLRHYFTVFDTVELNYSFYHMPLEKTLRRWKEETPPGCLWAIKASRYITHIKRLQDVAEPVRTLVDRVAIVSPKGPILFQLPPSLKYEAPRLDGFLKTLPRGRRYAMEFRHPSWFEPASLDRLRRANVALCVSDTAGKYPCVCELTADFTYLRLHGHEQLYASAYKLTQLREWTRQLRAWGKDAYVYFDNTMDGHAAQDAQRLRRLLSAQRRRR